MQSNLIRRAVFVFAASCVGALVPLSVSAMTTAQAMSSVAFLKGSWHCTGGGPPEDDVYTFTKNVWRDTDSLGGITSGTFDAKRQKWVVLSMNADGEYGVNEGPPFVKNTSRFTFPYPPGMSSHSFTVTKFSDTKFTLGKQTCTKQ
jgi:hypothetical protein